MRGEKCEHRLVYGTGVQQNLCSTVGRCLVCRKEVSIGNEYRIAPGARIMFEEGSDAPVYPLWVKRTKDRA